MHQIAKKITSVLAALAIGGGMVFLALKGSSISTSIMEKNDSQGSSWKDSLIVIPSSSQTSLLGAQYTNKRASSTTEFVTNELVADYISMQKAKGDTPLSDAELQQIVQSVTKKVQTEDTVRLYNENDLTVVQADDSTIAAYQKEFSGSLTSFAKKNTANELLFVAQALDDKDASKLAPLAENITNYQTLMNELLAMSVPRSHVNFHLSVVQGYANMLAGLVDMREIITDPARGMRGIAKYQSGAQLLAKILAALNTR